MQRMNAIFTKHIHFFISEIKMQVLVVGVFLANLVSGNVINVGFIIAYSHRKSWKFAKNDIHLTIILYL